MHDINPKRMKKLDISENVFSHINQLDSPQERKIVSKIMPISSKAASSDSTVGRVTRPRVGPRVVSSPERSDLPSFLAARSQKFPQG